MKQKWKETKTLGLRDLKTLIASAEAYAVWTATNEGSSYRVYLISATQ